jgi:hypothetical protein
LWRNSRGRRIQWPAAFISSVPAKRPPSNVGDKSESLHYVGEIAEEPETRNNP